MMIRHCRGRTVTGRRRVADAVTFRPILGNAFARLLSLTASAA